jgi:amino acid adenylation domain-containing protein
MDSLRSNKSIKKKFADQRIGVANFLSDAQYNDQIISWNNTAFAYPADRTLHSLFADQVEKTPNAPAVVFEDTILTYHELNERSNRLAHYLIDKHGIKSDDLVLLCLDRSEYLLIGVLGILKAGAAYVPVDPGCPVERIGYMLEDTGTRAVVTNAYYCEDFSQEIAGDGVSVIGIDSQEVEGILNSYSSVNPVTQSLPTDLAYVIYTSGTTGKPKGVMIEHGSFLNLLNHYKVQHFGDGQMIDTLSLTNYVFDIWGLEYGLPLLSGGQLTLSDSDFISIDASKYSFLQFTPGVLGAKYELICFNNPKLKLFVGGEALPASLLETLIGNPAVELNTLVNVYGPTETTVWSLDRINTPSDYNTLIGKPISNTKVYVLDKEFKPLPVGATGELYIGGAGVARGYLNLSALTAERFITNPFQTAEEKSDQFNGRLYRTGDLVRYRADGSIEYLGRNDFQVKIRGYRIELGEIENALTTYPEVRQSVVVALEDASGNKYLAGYYVSVSPLLSSELMDHISGQLPEYMLPAVLVHMDALPLTVNGKIDRRSLPEPDFADGSVYQGPETELQEQLCKIWGGVIGTDPETVGINDDFFRLGGNSIKAIRLVSQMNKVLDKGIKVAELFQYRTVAHLSAFIEVSDTKDIIISAPMVIKPEEQLLSYAQERLWFLEAYSGGSSAYNLPVVIGLEPSLSADSLVRAIRAVVCRHEVLRSQILQSAEGEGYQKVMDDGENPIQIGHEIFQDRTDLETAIATSVNHVFDLSSGYPIAVKLYTFQQERYLSVVVHHIAFDGWSTAVFVRDLLHYYRYYQQLGVFSKLPPLDLQYKEYALWHRGHLSGELLDKQLRFWKSRTAGFETLLLPLDRPRPVKLSYQGDGIEFEIDEQTGAGLRAAAKELKVSMYSLLLSSYYLLLHTYSGQNDITVGTPVSNRHYRQTEDMVGFFVNMLALRAEITSGEELSGFIVGVARMVEESQGHQDLPFEQLVGALNIEKDASRHPVFQVMFVLDNFGENLKAASQGLFKPYTKRTGYTVARYDLTLTLDDSEKRIGGSFNYATSLFNAGTIEGYIATYKQILNTISVLTNK